VWFKEFTPGSFVVGWPESVETAIKTTAEPPKNLPPRLEVTQLSRAEELAAMHHMSLRPLAKKLGIDIAGKDTEKLIDAILAAEADLKTAATPEPAAAELAGY